MNYSLKKAKDRGKNPGNGKPAGWKLVFIFLLALTGSASPILAQVTKDTVPPKLIVAGPDTVIIEVTKTALKPIPEPKVISADDLVDGNLTGSVIINDNTVQTNILGIYTITYSVSDLSGNTATVYRYLNVIDTIKPVLNLVGKDPMMVEVYTGFLDPGVKATDNYYSTSVLNSLVVALNNVDTSKLGVYTVTYNLTDPAGNHATTVTRTVYVIDTIPPGVSLNGPLVDSVDVFSHYNDPGVTFSDNFDKKPGVTITITGTFYAKFPNGKPTLIGIYTIIYTATDKSGNKQTVTRTVRVIDRVAPVIILKGNVAVSVCQGTKYVDPGYKFSDNYDSAAGATITEEGSFVTYGTTKAGLFTLRYKAVDRSGNVAYSDWRYIQVKPYTDFSCGSGMTTSLDTTMCKNSCADITAQYSGTSYKWSTGSTKRTIHFCPTRDTAITVTTTTGTKTISFVYYIHVTKTTCVWPGDANNDMTADKGDLLAIGIAYGDTGAKRAGATLTWSGQPCDNWKKAFKSGENYKNADCNGDGVVDSTDMIAITKNYGKTHPKAAAPNGGASDPPLYVKFSRDSAVAGDTVSATFNLGTSAIPATKVYGVKFSVNYSAQYIKVSHTLPDFSNCWIGTPGKDMIYMVHNDSENGILDVAVTRIDHKTIDGYGTVGIVGMVMQDNLGGKRWIDRTVLFNINDVTMITNQEDLLPVNALPDSIRAYKDRTGIQTNQADLFKVDLYPNPVSHNFVIDAVDQNITSIKVVDILGKEVYNAKTSGTSKINISAVAMNPGIYSVVITTKKGSVVKHFIKEE